MLFCLYFVSLAGTGSEFGIGGYFHSVLPKNRHAVEKPLKVAGLEDTDLVLKEIYSSIGRVCPNAPFVVVGASTQSQDSLLQQAYRKFVSSCEPGSVDYFQREIQHYPGYDERRCEYPELPVVNGLPLQFYRQSLLMSRNAFVKDLKSLRFHDVSFVKVRFLYKRIFDRGEINDFGLVLGFKFVLFWQLLFGVVFPFLRSGSQR